MGDMLILDNIVLLCGPCWDQDQQRRVIARLTIPDPARVSDTGTWMLDLRFPSAFDKSDTSIDTWMVFGENHRWMCQGWDWHEGPIAFDGCGKHHLERGKGKLAKVIARAHSAGETEVFVNG